MCATLEPASKLVLMKLQYEMPIEEEPFSKVAEAVGTSVDRLLALLRSLKEAGVLKRVGFLLNYRSLGRVSALVGFGLKDEAALARLSKELAGDANVKHSYLRDHPTYNLWFTYKAGSREELLRRVSELASRFRVREYVVLESKRTYKLSVKYELFRGVSWSKPGVVPENPPTVEDLGVDRRALRLLSDLPLTRRPYREAGAAAGLDEATLLGLVKELIAKGVILDYGAVLDGQRAGFAFNAMVTLSGGAATCEWIALNVPEASHVVLREAVEGEWPYDAYMVVHGVSRDVVEACVSHVARALGAEDYCKLYSVKCLKSG